MALEGDISETHFLYLLDSIILKILSATLLADQTPVLKLKIAKSTVTLNKSACSPQFCQADAGNCWWINQTSSRKQEMSFFTVRAVAGRRAWCWPDLGLILFHCSQCVSLDKQAVCKLHSVSGKTDSSQALTGGKWGATPAWSCCCYLGLVLL